MRTARILSSLLLCTSAVSASWLSDSAFLDLLLPHKRAPQAVTLGSDSAATPNPSQTIATQTSSASSTQSSGSATGSASNSQSTTTGSGSSSATKTSSSKSSTTVIDPRLPPGGISMITPNPRSSTSYYKIGNYVTFAWNYTSLSVTPSAIDIIATCTHSQVVYTYPIALNQTVDGPTGAITWDTNGYQATATPGLVTETYTLVVHDAQRAVTAAAQAGYLGTYSQFAFGMYLPQPYKDLDNYVCVTCSGALSQLERQSLTAVGIMATAAVLGATWFSGGMLSLL